MFLNGAYYPPPPSSASCQLCQDLRIRSEEEESGFLGMPLWKMDQSARNGCFICRILFNAVMELTRHYVIPSHLARFGNQLIGFNIRSEAVPTEVGQGVGPPRPLSLVLKTENAEVAELEVFTLQDKPATKWPLIGPARILHDDASDKHCVALMRSWIDNCVATHSECPGSTEPVMPDRLVYVGTSTNPVDPFLCLNNPAARGKYATLSHCWGGKVAESLRSNTLGEFLDRIPDTALPLTFQHAVEACRSLGIEFLWIDSLCIVQGVESDWLTQSAKMYQYYGDSWVTIAADGAKDSTIGFLRDSKREMKVKCFEYAGDGGDHEPTGIFVRWKGVGGPRDTFSHHVWKAPQQSALSYRGWTLQESLLAPRILHYTAEEVVFECRKETRCECQVYPHHIPTMPPVKMAAQDQTGDFDGRWAVIADHYSSRDLTEQADKLIAISGVARSMNPHGPSYKAGLWIDQFPNALLWMTYDYNGFEVRQASKRITRYQAPTWSWASVTGRAILHRSTAALISDIEIVSWSLKLLGQDPFGPLKSASITVKGFLAPVTVAENMTIPPAARRRAQNRFQIVIRTRSREQQIHTGVFPDVHGEQYEIIPGSMYWMLPVCHDANGVWNGILLSEDEALRDSYRRVGRVDGVNIGYLKFMTMATWKEIQMI